MGAVPAPGYRERANGGLTNVGNNGYSWSSTVSENNALRLNFNTTWVDPSSPNNRAYGFQVRCLQAFISILFFDHQKKEERSVSGVAVASF